MPRLGVTIDATRLVADFRRSCNWLVAIKHKPIAVLPLSSTTRCTHQGRGDVEEHAVEEAQLVDFRDIRLPELFLEH